MAALSADLVHCTRQQAVIFDAVNLNQGGLYNPAHGIFRTNVSGTYVFTATLSASPHSNLHVAFVKNTADNEFAYVFAENPNVWTEHSTTVLVHLAAGDEVWMVCLGDSRLEGNYNHSWEGAGDFHSHISGFLLSAD